MGTSCEGDMGHQVTFVDHRCTGKKWKNIDKSFLLTLFTYIGDPNKMYIYKYTVLSNGGN